ncbi:MAG: UTP--glucose-1-phosphate uridylyltransferase [Candidatus Methylacidiphilales bacterium]|nr:UTP--glucose-1-phosphate uridylyltransferase [Candidatus Methylacidiphilales bacterium]
MTDRSGHSQIIRSKMQAAGQGGAAIEAFLRSCEVFRSGDTGMIPEDRIVAVDDLLRWEELPDLVDPSLLARAAVVKLNGGLGTSMGLDKAKSLLPVKNGANFLDLTLRQLAHLATGTGTAPCFILLNSFSTSADTRAHLAAHPVAGAPEPWEMIQSQVPKLNAATAAPVAWPDQPDLEWCPPGHGDIYPTLFHSGLIEKLEARGIQTLFFSNSDNLGAVLDPRILTWFVRGKLPFLMEVAERTPSDRKGGHLARRREDGALILRESAQCPSSDESAFQDIKRHRFFNTNNLWISLPVLKEALTRSGGFLPLPLIVNRKTVDPRNKQSTPVVQLETAMGAAIGFFPGAAALVVPRSRFAPVKTTSDLLVVRSDAYALSPAHTLAARSQPVVRLDDRFYKNMADFEARFPDGPPSLVGCRSLTVQGDWTFSSGVVCQGEVDLRTESPRSLPAGEVTGVLGQSAC